MIDFNTEKSQELLEESMNDIIEKQPHIWNVIKGSDKPKRCEQCEYCRATKHILKLTHADEV